MLITLSLLAQFFAGSAAAQTGQPQDKRKYPDKVPVVKKLPTPEKSILVGKLPNGGVVVSKMPPFVSMKKVLAVYDRDDFTGASKPLGFGKYDSAALGELNEKISSIASLAADEGFTVDLCLHSSTAFACYQYLFIPYPQDFLRKEKLQTVNLDNKVSYIEIKQFEPSLVVYDLINQKGQSKKFWTGVNSGNESGFYFHSGDKFKNKISSVKVRDGYSAFLCKLTSVQMVPSPSNCETYGAGVHNVRAYLNNDNNFVQIRKL